MPLPLGGMDLTVTGAVLTAGGVKLRMRAIGRLDDAMSGSGGGSPEGSWEFWFWPPVPPAARQIRVIVSTLWEAAWAEIDIPGRPA